jgi:acetoin:2,6-dichlorophenolindophenol oxidoreductase subunit alpha
MENQEQDLILSIEKEKVLKLYETMLKIRLFESREKSLIQTEQEGFAHSYVGEEAIATGVCSALRKDDYITSTHRGHGHLIAKGGDLAKMYSELYGRQDGYCHGKSGSLHIADFELGVLGANGIVSGGIPIAVGAAYSIQLRKTDQVAVAFFGEGAMNQGLFHEAANMASVFNVPVVFIVEVNHWQCGVRYETVYHPNVINNIAIRAQSYGFPGININGNDVIEVYLAAKNAIEHARSGKGPYLLACYTYRVETHFMGDIDIRPTEEVEDWKKKDPILNFEKRMISNGLISGALIEEYKDRVSTSIETAIEFARKSPYPAPETALEHVYSKY